MYNSQNKWCFVPGCKNTSVSAPNKKFLTIPQDYSRKIKWFEAAKRDVSKSKSTFFCCEDHFNKTNYTDPEILSTVIDFNQPSTSSEQVIPGAHEHVKGADECMDVDKIVQFKSVAVQVKPLYRSKYVTCNIKSNLRHTASSPIKFLMPKGVATSTIKNIGSIKKTIFTQPSTSSGTVEVESSSSVFATTSDSDLTEVKLLEDKKIGQKQTLNVTL
ncbi:hypothetical protein NQ314_001923 [Rhamnusium bicolor]|uniref:THAP-type domain-containing protein n=1 Tax=Rhamnusium bicolor TaxID=1586634 RepID=A0AAV8ZRH5_9CUCU|nr:hypothetical protein NQ314_001923 [Rhamnusium bicolor]